MALTDAWLKANVGKQRPKQEVKTDRDALSVRISPKGKITFQYRYRHDGKQDRMDLGAYPAMTLKEARDDVDKWKEELKQGHNPKLVKKALLASNATAMTTKELIDKWFDQYCYDAKKGSKEIYRSFELYVFPKLGVIPVSMLNFHTWLELLEKLVETKPVIADRILTNTSQCFRWAVKRRYIETNVLAGFHGKELGVVRGEGDRVLSHEEIRYVWRAAENSRMTEKNALFFMLCLFFGCRNGELRRADVSHFDLEKNIWEVPPEHNKGNWKAKKRKSIFRPFPDEVKELILRLIELNRGSTHLITCAGSTKMLTSSATLSIPYKIMQHCKVNMGKEIPHFSFHDLRRTARTNFSTLTEPHIAEKMLGHSLGKIWEVYDHHEYIEEQRVAYAKWWTRLQNIVYGEGKVVELAPKRA